MGSAERDRLNQDKLREKDWKRWGPYLSERQWGTVREDYSEDGDCWNHFPHDQARSRAYRWGEDGLLGICDRKCRLCLSLGLWNTKDAILKERLFGLTGHEGNHGEDVKELYYYIDSTPTHSYMSALYKYPQAAYPYPTLVESNKNRSAAEPELEILDTGVFDNNEYFDVLAEYCKATPNNILGRYVITNRGPAPATVHVLPTLWFRNVWSWGEECYCYEEQKPHMSKVAEGKVVCQHPTLGSPKSHSKRRSRSITDLLSDVTPGVFYFEVDLDQHGNSPDLLFTENDSNLERLFGSVNTTNYVKDAFHYYVIDGQTEKVNPAKEGTKCAAHYKLHLAGGEEAVIRVRLYNENEATVNGFSHSEFDEMFEQRQKEADAFYNQVIPNRRLSDRTIVRQAYAGLLWSKQFYYYVIKHWLAGDSAQPRPPAMREKGRNSDWKHLFNRDVISMPDKWEYPWYASWDLAFHMIPMANIDISFAKEQILLLLREWYMHPNGQIPAYEFCLEDVNPPVHAYASLKIYKASGPKGKRDVVFLARCFHKLMLNFTWWVNRKDPSGRNIFSGGFLGLDNIGIFDRSKPLPTGGRLVQADGTAWMSFFCSIMLEISLILAKRDPTYEDMASKFFEHFVAIIDAINQHGNVGLWNEEDGFYYDHVKDKRTTYPLKIMSVVGVVPLFSTLVLKFSDIKIHSHFYKRTKWFLKHRKDLTKRISFFCQEGQEEAILLSIVKKEQLKRVLTHILNEDEFLSPYGIRSLSKRHLDTPFKLDVNGTTHSVQYEPGESETNMFGGNSNWRGPIWFPLNYLLIENLYRFDYYYGDSLKVECPTGSGRLLRLRDVARELCERLVSLFVPDKDGRRPCHGEDKKYSTDPNYRDLVLFYEYFHGDTGRGCGASHQTGWTALVASLFKQIQQHSVSATGSLCDISSEGEAW
ncbi:uncharacterized protein YMR196W-like [Mizuhopecten yessoensis]|uniref:uncharacterized protein YMR196W-like n=1 Tax=Mizuhopecten yessoensis TaxID=6573 RepID=UPI000B45D5A9|nr:uncharacterized protein YMR196W-like [Mizuhopecten yessoensis]